MKVLSLTDEERERAERARAEAEAARRAADEKLAAEAEARRKRDAERVKLQLAPSAPPPPAKPAGPTKEQLEAAAAKVCIHLQLYGRNVRPAWGCAHRLLCTRVCLFHVRYLHMQQKSVWPFQRYCFSLWDDMD